MFIDTHCHLNIMSKKNFDSALSQRDLKVIEDFIDEANASGVGKIITVGTSLIESINSIKIAQTFSGVFATVGIHPCDCGDKFVGELHQIEKLIGNKDKNKIVAIGETGLDFYHKPFDKNRQIDAFKRHIDLALRFDLPIVVHVRDSADDVLKILEAYKNELRGVIHCFMQTLDFAEIVLSWGFFIGINAPITYPKNKWLVDILNNIPVEKILLETDAPFLPPQQFRGKQNKPSYIPIFAKFLAQIKNIDLVDLENITTANSEKLFGI